MSHPIEGQAVLLAGAKASVPLERIQPLLVQAATHLRDVDLAAYECVHRDDERTIYLAEADFWRTAGEELALERREWDAIRRAHDQQLRRVGSRAGRRDEFETALEIRTAVVVETPTGGRAG